MKCNISHRTTPFLLIFLDSEMVHLSVCGVFLLFYIHGSVTSSLSLNPETLKESKVLHVGEELMEETLPLRMGSRLYQLHGLKPSMWYEVKISYPASIPASFSIQLKRGKTLIGLKHNRRLLNTEKLIFMIDGDKLNPSEGEMYVLVSVEPAGVVATQKLQEREYVIYNIVCDELSYGIPHEACWVGVLVLLCLGVAFALPYFLPSFLLRKSKAYA